MNRMFSFGSVLIAAASLLVFFGRADGEQAAVLSRNVQKFINRDCEKNNTCDLAQFTMMSEDYMVYADGKQNFGARMYADYETESIESLTRYGFVQFMRGCVFLSVRTSVGKGIIKISSILKEYFGRERAALFPTWVLDSQDSDPLYWSRDPKVFSSRHKIYRWTEVPWDPPFAYSREYGDSPPDIPRLYVTDKPSPAYISKGIASNSSLQFRLCLYKTADVPLTSDPNNVNFADPIKCFSWQNSFVYNHDKDKYESPQELDPYCLGAHDIKISK